MTQPVANDCNSGGLTGLHQPVLREIADLLEHYSQTGKAGAIDLRSMPMSDDDRAELENALGRGEVAAQLNLAGQSEVWETRFAGVWWVRHKGNDGRIAAEIIEVTNMPAILKSDPADMRLASKQLTAELSAEPVSANIETASEPMEETHV